MKRLYAHKQGFCDNFLKNNTGQWFVIIVECKFTNGDKQI